jgi:hypothetical protein
MAITRFNRPKFRGVPFVGKLFGLIAKNVMRSSILIAIAIIIGALFFFGRTSGNSSSDSRVQIADSIDKTDVNEVFTFPLIDGAGEEVSRVEYKIETAELKNEILVKGKKASSVKGRTFLVLSVKVKNSYNRAIEVETRDYLRLSVNGNEEEWLAPDIHNDPVSIQADSTKVTRLAFPINETDRDLRLRIGEIRGEKKTISLNLKYK